VEVHPQSDQKQHNRLLLELLRIKPEGSWPHAVKASRIVPGRGNRELLIFLTDMYQHGQELSDFVKGLKTKNNEVVVLQLMGGREMEFDYRDSLTFEDLETGAKLKVDVKKARANYLEALEANLTQIKEEMGALGVHHHLFRMDRELGNALRLFLRERERLN